jgi:hypothetical protein
MVPCDVSKGPETRQDDAMTAPTLPAPPGDPAGLFSAADQPGRVGAGVVGRGERKQIMDQADAAYWQLHRTPGRAR